MCFFFLFTKCFSFFGGDYPGTSSPLTKLFSGTHVYNYKEIYTVTCPGISWGEWTKILEFQNVMKICVFILKIWILCPVKAFSLLFFYSKIFKILLGSRVQYPSHLTTHLIYLYYDLAVNNSIIIKFIYMER